MCLSAFTGPCFAVSLNVSYVIFPFHVFFLHLVPFPYSSSKFVLPFYFTNIFFRLTLLFFFSSSICSSHPLPLSCSFSSFQIRRLQFFSLLLFFNPVSSFLLFFHLLLIPVCFSFLLIFFLFLVFFILITFLIFFFVNSSFLTLPHPPPPPAPYSSKMFTPFLYHLLLLLLGSTKSLPRGHGSRVTKPDKSRWKDLCGG